MQPATEWPAGLRRCRRSSGSVLGQGGERQAGVLRPRVGARPRVAAVDQAWPGRVFRLVAQPQRHPEGDQLDLGALVGCDGSAGDAREQMSTAKAAYTTAGQVAPCLKPATWRQLGAGAVTPQPSRSGARCRYQPRISYKI